MPLQPRTVAVVGAGTMGHGIAQAAAMAGFVTHLYDNAPGAVDAALARVRADLEAGVERGKLDAEVRDLALGSLYAAPALRDAVHAAEVVIEAVPEQLALKTELFARLGLHAPDEAILASNTSALSVSRLAAVTRRPERVLGLHFFNPVPRMRLVEVVRADATSDATLSAAIAFVRALGKQPIVVSDTPGFASSRLGVVLGLEAMRMLEQGVAEPAEIDRAMELGYHHPVGPLRLSDLIGLDVRLAIAEHLHRELGGEQYRAPEILRRLVAEGKLGRKSGEGFYRWDER